MLCDMPPFYRAATAQSLVPSILRYRAAIVRERYQIGVNQMKSPFLFALTGVLLAAAVSMRAETHELKLIPANVHWGYYDARLKPVLKIASGDTVRVETMVAGGLERVRMAGVLETEIPDSLKRVEDSVTDRGPGAHPLTGPIYVEGAQTG